MPKTFSLRRALYWLSAPGVVYGLFAYLPPLAAASGMLAFFGLASLIAAGGSRDENVAVGRLLTSLILFALALVIAAGIVVESLTSKAS